MCRKNGASLIHQKTMEEITRLCIRYALHILCKPFFPNPQKILKSTDKISNLLFYFLYRRQMKKWMKVKQLTPRVLDNTIFLLAERAVYANAVLMAQTLESFGFKTKIYTQFDIMEHLDDLNLYIILTPYYFENNLPINYISFNFEQSTYEPTFTDKYIQMLDESLAILDYTKINIEYLKKRGIPAEKLYCLPMCPECCDDEIIEHKSTDCIFYGGRSARRQAILPELQQSTSLQVIENVYGDALEQILKKSGIIVNIHSRENAILETTRICEAISHGCLVISESCCNYDEFPELHQMVEFVPAGDTKAMAERISYWQENPEKLKEKLRENNRIATSCKNKYRETLRNFLVQHHIMDANS